MLRMGRVVGPAPFHMRHARNIEKARSCTNIELVNDWVSMPERQTSDLCTENEVVNGIPGKTQSA